MLSGEFRINKKEMKKLLIDLGITSLSFCEKLGINRHYFSRIMSKGDPAGHKLITALKNRLTKEQFDSVVEEID